MAESVAFTYNGSDTVVATILNAVPGTTYILSTTGSLGYDEQTAASSTLVLTVSDISDPSPDDRFYGTVRNSDTNFTYGATVFEYGQTGEYEFVCEWDYDGAQTISVAGVFDNGVVYGIDANGSLFDSYLATGITGTGTSQILSMTCPGDGIGSAAIEAGDVFLAQVYEISTGGNPQTIRLFTGGVASSGSPGNPGAGSSGLTLIPASPGSKTLSAASKGEKVLSVAAAGSKTLVAASKASKTLTPSSSGSKTLTPVSPG